jgi:hypothetical protein
MVDPCERDRRLLQLWNQVKAMRLPGNVKVIVMDVAQRADLETGKATVGIRVLAKATGTTSPTVVKALAAAEQVGLIERLVAGWLNGPESVYRVPILLDCARSLHSEAAVTVQEVCTKKRESKKESPTESLSPASPPSEEEVVLRKNPPSAKSKNPAPTTTIKPPPRPLEKDGSWKSIDGLHTLAAEEIDDLLQNCLLTEIDLRRRLQGALDPPSPQNPKHGWARAYEGRAISVITGALHRETAKELARSVTPEQAAKLQKDRPWRDMRPGPARDQMIIRAHPEVEMSHIRTYGSLNGTLKHWGQPHEIQQALDECPDRVEAIARQKERDEADERRRQWQQRDRERRAARQQAASA